MIRCAVRAEAIRVSVSDTGLGIKAEDIAALFQPFSQLDNSLRKRHEGTGLGLLAVLIGAELTVTTEYGKGSTFIIEIPYPHS